MYKPTQQSGPARRAGGARERARSEARAAVSGERGPGLEIAVGVLFLLATLSPVAGASGAPAQAGVAGRPNVLFVTFDDLAATRALFDNPQIVAPNFDRLAKRALRFDRAYAQFPSCNPSRTSMLLGLRPDATGVLTNDTFFRTLLPDQVTLPEFFRTRGYLTIGLGKVFHASGGESWNDARSWDFYENPGGRIKGRRGKGRNVTGGEVGWARWVAARGRDKHQADGQTALAAAAALADLYSSERRFFLAVGFRRPHSPYIVPKSYFELYRLGKLTLHQPPAERTEEIPQAVPAFPKLTRRDQRELLRGYYAAISFADRQLGRLLDVLDRANGWKNTIVVVTSDHGFHLGQHEWWGKNTVFDAALKVPLLVHAPDFPRKRKSSPRAVELLDLYPTVVDLAGLETPAHLQGRSLVPLLQDPRAEWSFGAFSQVLRGFGKAESVRTGRWRYTEWNGGADGVELYDHRADPDEYRNLADRGELAELMARLAIHLDTAFPD